MVNQVDFQSLKDFVTLISPSGISLLFILISTHVSVELICLCNNLLRKKIIFKIY